MPSFNIVKTWQAPDSYRVKAVISQFTLEDVELKKQFQGFLDIEGEKWQIGIIVGRSATGKTSIARQLFPNEYVQALEYGEGSILDDFPKELSVSDVTKALCSVGFASPPDWLKSYKYLSQGEKMRVDVARALTLPQKLIVFDEFTSVVDRDIAQISCVAVSKAVRKTDKQFIAVSCHYDIVDWLEPDWVFNTDSMTLLKKNGDAPQLKSKSLSVNETVGDCLGTITI